MDSYPTGPEVLDDLGGKIVEHLARAVRLTVADLREYRRLHPNWVAEHCERGLANWIHDRLWTHLSHLFDMMDDVTIRDEEPTREIYFGTRYRLRAKRHAEDGSVSMYPTQAALEFLGQQALEGLEELHLIVGYEWDSTNRLIGPAVLSMRDGTDKLLWLEYLPPVADEGTPPTPATVPPTPTPKPPTIHLGSDASSQSDEGDRRSNE